jgi:magnesium-transporting ATPase (P-type)
VWSFLPIFLLESFARLANAYFLVVCILQCIPSISITAGLPYSFLPLSIVLLFDGFATAREDYKRHQDDDRANNSRSEARGAARRSTLRARWSFTPPSPPPAPAAALTLRDGAFIETSWSAIRVGDVVKLLRNAPVPAD